MTRRDFDKGPFVFDSAARPDDWHTLIQEFGQIGSWSAILEDGICWWSDGIYRIYGVSKDIERAPPMEDFFLQDGAAQIEKALARAVATGESWRLLVPFKDAHGNRRWVQSTGAARRDPHGKTNVYGCFQDVTAIQSLRAEAVESQRLVESILNSIPHMIFLKDAKDLRFVRLNKAGEALLGIDAAALIGRSDHDLFPKDQADFFVAKDRATIQGSVPIEIPEEPINTAYGPRTLHTRKFTLTDERGEPAYLLGISEDITERLAQRATIETQRAALLTASRLSALGQMAGGVAHEINNPLAVIKGAADQINRLLRAPDVDVDLERLQLLAGMVSRTVDRIAAIVSGLKDFSRDGSRDPLHVTPVVHLVQETLAMCAEKLRLSGVEIDCSEVAGDVAIECQPIRIAQVLLNLVVNAFDAVAHAPTKIIRIGTRAAPDGGLAIEVSDTGPGVPAELVDAIMEPFFTTKGPGKGTGLGLSISKGICEDHDGTLTVRPTSSGACLAIALPAARVRRLEVDLGA